MKSLDTANPAPKKLTLTKETLRRLTAPELRLAVGGAICTVKYSSCSDAC
jgi:hypothetical protein